MADKVPLTKEYLTCKNNYKYLHDSYNTTFKDLRQFNSLLKLQQKKEEIIIIKKQLCIESYVTILLPFYSIENDSKDKFRGKKKEKLNCTYCMLSKCVLVHLVLHEGLSAAIK